MSHLDRLEIQLQEEASPNFLRHQKIFISWIKFVLAVRMFTRNRLADKNKSPREGRPRDPILRQKENRNGHFHETEIQCGDYCEREVLMNSLIQSTFCIYPKPFILLYYFSISKPKRF
jgi:hypothetical protein